jgi:hypothetical protein
MLALDQHGNTLYIEGKFPRKELMEHHKVKSAQKMYIDKIAGPDKGKIVHVGYVVSGHWYRLFAEWERVQEGLVGGNGNK